MSESLNEQTQIQDESVRPSGAPGEQQPAAVPAPSFAPGDAIPGEDETGVLDEEMVEAGFPEEGYRPPTQARRSKGRRLVPKAAARTCRSASPSRST